ncbi:porin family protein [Emticicia sp. SJ17W-69]|uniref:porin family protein n=1 Tax=Emticicia sp. SJ17W-69 TaxID=3421657 RepID=UPI003EBF6E12
MKNKHIIVAVLMLIASTSVSQAQIKFGIRAGLNASNVSFPNLPDRKERFGFHVGAFADVPVSPNFMSIQPELSYSVKGAGFKFLNERQTVDLNYIDFLVPVAFKLDAFDLQVGPFVSYLISSPNYKFYNDNTVMVNAFKKVDAGLTAGLSYNFSKIIVGVRYNQGFIDVTQDNSRPFLGSGKNAVGQVSLGYKF